MVLIKIVMGLMMLMQMVMGILSIQDCNDQDARFIQVLRTPVTTMWTLTVTETPIGTVMAMVKTAIKMVVSTCDDSNPTIFLVRLIFGMMVSTPTVMDFLTLTKMVMAMIRLRSVD